MFIKHLAGKYIQGIQRCILCGEVICDYTNALWPADSPPPSGWPEGEVYVSVKGNPTITQTSEPEHYENCGSKKPD